MKYCGSCETEKDISEFGKRAASKDGLAFKCKSCQRVYDKARSKDESRRLAREIYAQTEEGKIAGNKAKAAYRDRNPAKSKAHAVVSRQIRAGNLFSEPCETCGETSNVVAHHDDYAKPLNVRWLCPPCHFEWHKENGEGLNGDLI